jgi:hypothetical protein
MALQAPLFYKLEFLRRWPARLDQELRTQFGDALSPKTSFDKEAKKYTTAYAGEPLDEVNQFISGFYAAVSMVAE